MSATVLIKKKKWCCTIHIQPFQQIVKKKKKKCIYSIVVQSIILVVVKNIVKFIVLMKQIEYFLNICVVQTMSFRYYFCFLDLKQWSAKLHPFQEFEKFMKTYYRELWSCNNWKLALTNIVMLLKVSLKGRKITLQTIPTPATNTFHKE